MVTHKPLDDTRTPPSGSTQPPQTTSSSSDPWSDEPSESAWGDVAPPRQTGATGSVIRRKEVPASLKPGAGAVSGGFGAALEDEEDNVWNEARGQASGSARLDQVPDALKPGGNKSDTNPFLRKKVPYNPKLDSPPSIPQPVQPPTEPFSKMGLDEANNLNPWQSAVDAQSTPADSQPRPVVPGDTESDPWAQSTPEPPPKQPLAPRSPALVSLHSEGSAWDDDSRSERGQKTAPPQTTAMFDELLHEPHVWDDLGSLDMAKVKGKATELSAGQAAQLDDWSLIDSDPSSSPPKQPQDEVPTEKPPLPPRRSGERARWIPSRLPVDSKAETYQVKNIHWHDATSTTNPRVSPILIQNENGPCPLVALVNALTLTTPADIPDTALVQVLRSREQVSLSLLLDAVFDELMSPRRTTSEDSLPDVSDLYAFLQSLHTGMNVNPRFIPTPEVVAAYKHTTLTHLHPNERGGLIPGTFENTMEMSLYATFSIPLIHGWLPPADDAVYTAMERHAASYEDVQNLLFREEELEDKLSNSESGLSEAEQELYQDIITIKIFLHESATQLTPWGIEVIGRAIRPGTFAILFRNDHFSTLYCHPQTRKLYSLVTDAGYKGHDDVVWESLIDVNGEQNAFLSGDFRVTSGDGAAGSSNNAGSHADSQGSEWKTVTSKRGKTRAQEEAVPMSTSTEQEDRDLALALQLQEEEDERHREEEARRRQERILSEQYIEQQAHQPTPVNRNARGEVVVPQRRSSNGVNVPMPVPVTTTTSSSSPARPQGPAPAQQQVRPMVPPRRQGVNRPADTSEDAPPPTYEQAAQVPAYIPPPGHPNHANSNPAATTRRASRSSTSAGSGGRGGRRPPVPPSAVTGGSYQPRGDRDCIIM